MKRLRSNPACEAPDTACMMHGLPLNQCPDFQVGQNEPKCSAAPELLEGKRPLWSGNVLSATAAQLVCGLQRPPLIGLVGLTNSGKTSFLASLYLMFKARERLEWGRFAGSYTLRGWEMIAHAFLWRGTTPPGYPARTTGQGHEAGPLHLRLREGDAPSHDVLLTDALGEWFSHWIQKERGEDAQGARAVVGQADGFLFFVDSHALSTLQGRHTTLRLTQTLADRLAARVGDRAVQVVWSKADQWTSNAQSESLSGVLRSHFPDAQHLHTVAASAPGSPAQRQAVLEAVNLALNATLAPASASHETLPGRGARLLSWTRGDA